MFVTQKNTIRQRGKSFWTEGYLSCVQGRVSFPKEVQSHFSFREDNTAVVEYDVKLKQIKIYLDRDYDPAVSFQMGINKLTLVKSISIIQSLRAMKIDPILDEYKTRVISYTNTFLHLQVEIND